MVVPAETLVANAKRDEKLVEYFILLRQRANVSVPKATAHPYISATRTDFGPIAIANIGEVWPFTVLDKSRTVLSLENYPRRRHINHGKVQRKLLTDSRG
jgi:hypothetical protein